MKSKMSGWNYRNLVNTFEVGMKYILGMGKGTVNIFSSVELIHIFCSSEMRVTDVH